MSFAGCKPSPDGLVFECGHNSVQRLVGNAVSDETSARMWPLYPFALNK